MALAKLGPNITSITGKMAGNTFKRDASGQHVIATCRFLHKPSTPEQKKQRFWYAGHKRHERLDPPPTIPDNPPKDPYTARAYSIHDITTFRDPSVFNPGGEPPPDNEEEKAYAASIMSQYWFENKQALEAMGLTLYEISMICYRYFYIAKWTWGVIPAECWVTAIEATITFCERAILIGRIIPWFSVIGLYLTAVIFEIGEFFAGHWGSLSFDHWDMILRTSSKIYWAGLQARPSEDMYDVYRGPEIVLPFYQSWYEPSRDYNRAVFFEPGSLLQFVTHTIFLYYTWTFKDMHMIIIEDAHPIGSNLYRFKAAEFSKWYLNMDIGFSRTPEKCIDYINHLDEHFHST